VALEQRNNFKKKTGHGGRRNRVKDATINHDASQHLNKMLKPN